MRSSFSKFSKVIVILALGATQPVCAAPIGPAAFGTVDVRAAEILARSAAALRTADAVRADFVTSTTFPTPYRDTEERGTITVARPGRVRVDLNRYRRVQAGHAWEATGNGALIVADGTQVLSLTRHPASSQIRRDPQRPDLLVAALRGIDPLAGFFSPQSVAAAHYQGRRTLEGTAVDVVDTVTAGNGGEERREYFIREDGFPLRTITVSAAKKGGVVTRDVRLTNIRRNPSLAAETFTFTPPAGAIPVETPRLAQAAAKPSPLAVGQIAPDFTVQDAAGKPVHLSDYQGKTVLLKFWATWCWPCRQSLPGTQALAQSSADKEVVVLAVALWDSPTAFQAWTAANAPKFSALHFAFDPQPQGKDTGSALYGVTVTPTEFVIAPDRTIRAVFQGYDGPSPALAEAIKQAASGKAVAEK